MRKVLICVVIVLLIILSFFVIFKGISIGNFKVLSIKQIEDENEKLTQSIAQTESLMKVSYQSKVSELETSVSTLLNAKQEYLDLANISTVSEIRGAHQVEEYTVEYLMTKLGNHSSKQGVDLTYTLTPADGSDSTLKNITFNITGAYAAVINFIEAIEDDSSLGFRIYNFKMEQASGMMRRATFQAMGVKVKKENVSTDGGTTNKDVSGGYNSANTSNTSEGNITNSNTSSEENTANQNTSAEGNSNSSERQPMKQQQTENYNSASTTTGTSNEGNEIQITPAQN